MDEPEKKTHPLEREVTTHDLRDVYDHLSGKTSNWETAHLKKRLDKLELYVLALVCAAYGFYIYLIYLSNAKWKREE